MGKRLPLSPTNCLNSGFRQKKTRLIKFYSFSTLLPTVRQFGPGEGVKSLLTDEIAQSVAGETVQVPLREANKYNEAFAAASTRIATVLSGEPDPGAS